MRRKTATWLGWLLEKPTVSGFVLRDEQMLKRFKILGTLVSVVRLLGASRATMAASVARGCVAASRATRS